MSKAQIKMGQAVKMAINISEMKSPRCYAAEQGYVMQIVSEEEKSMKVRIVNDSTGEYIDMKVHKFKHKVYEYLYLSSKSLALLVVDEKEAEFNK